MVSSCYFVFMSTIKLEEKQTFKKGLSHKIKIYLLQMHEDIARVTNKPLLLDVVEPEQSSRRDESFLNLTHLFLTQTYHTYRHNL